MNWRLAAGWVLAVVLTTALAWQIVAFADERVGERPVSPVQAIPTTTTIELSAATGDTIPPDPTLPPPSDDLTTTTLATTSTSDDGATSSSVGTSTTSPSSSTTTQGWATKTIPTSGGTVVVSYRPGEVILETAVPKPGFQTDIEKAGPPGVEVDFESSSLKVAIKAEWKDGRLDVEIEEEPHGED